MRNSQQHHIVITGMMLWNSFLNYLLEETGILQTIFSKLSYPIDMMVEDELKFQHYKRCEMCYKLFEKNTKKGSEITII